MYGSSRAFRLRISSEFFSGSRLVGSVWSGILLSSTWLIFSAGAPRGTGGHIERESAACSERGELSIFCGLRNLNLAMNANVAYDIICATNSQWGLRVFHVEDKRSSAGRRHLPLLQRLERSPRWCSFVRTMLDINCCDFSFWTLTKFWQKQNMST